MPQKSAAPLFNLRVYPRMNIYIGGEERGTFVIDAGLSDTVGQPLCDSPGPGFIASTAPLKYIIKRADTGETLIDSAEVAFNTTGNEFSFPLKSFKAQFEPYDIVLQSTTPKCGKTFEAFEARTQLTVLPPRTDGGSVTKLDRLYGGILVQNATNDKVWEPIFPYSFYVDWGKYLAGNVDNAKNFADLGYNIVHPTPGEGVVPFDPTQFNKFLDIIEKSDLKLMYDMRWTFKNLASVTEQVNRLKTRKSILLWYTADEPDGNSDPLNSTVLAYDLIRKLDPYHPTSLVLNCQNFYYKEYTTGADIVLTDPYPVAVNTSFSNRWNTVCNATYGDCGCDNCHGGFRDVSDRMDTFTRYESLLADTNRPPKPLWGVPQAFGGSEYWLRPPTGQEEAVMATLFINHNAKGLVAWNFPTTPELTQTTSKFAKVLRSKEATSLLLGAKPESLSVKGGDNIDAAAWRVDKKMLVSVVHMGTEPLSNVVTVKLPKEAKNLKLLWPTETENTWVVDGTGLTRPNLKPLDVSILSFDLT